MEYFRRNVSNDMAQDGPFLKNIENTYHPCFGFTPETGTSFPKTVVSFLLCW